MNDEYDVTDNVTLDDDVNESVIDSISEDVSSDNGSNITVVINNPASTKSDELSENENKVSTKVEPEEYRLVDINISKQAITASNTTGLKSTVLSIIGDYETTVTDYVYQSSNGYQNHSINVEPDYAWICTLALFLVCLYSMFRLYGLVFGKGGRR